MEEALPLLQEAGSELRSFMAHIPELTVFTESIVEPAVPSGYTATDADIESILQALREVQIDAPEKVSVIKENQNILEC